jgi:hypothetical protein
MAHVLAARNTRVPAKGADLNDHEDRVSLKMAGPGTKSEDDV